MTINIIRTAAVLWDVRSTYIIFFNEVILSVFLAALPPHVDNLTAVLGSSIAMVLSDYLLLQKTGSDSSGSSSSSTTGSTIEFESIAPTTSTATQQNHQRHLGPMSTVLILLPCSSFLVCAGAGSPPTTLATKVRVQARIVPLFLS